MCFQSVWILRYYWCLKQTSYQASLVIIASTCVPHDDVIQWKQFPRYWPFVRGIHRSPVNSPHKGQWPGSLMFSLIYVWVINSEAGNFRCHRAHYYVTVIHYICRWSKFILHMKCWYIRLSSVITRVFGDITIIIMLFPRVILEAKVCKSKRWDLSTYFN